MEENLELKFLFFLANKGKVYFGLLKEPDINIPVDDDDDAGDGEDRPKVHFNMFYMIKLLYINFYDLF